MKQALLVLTLCTALAACSLLGIDDGPGALPLSQLRAAPDTLTIDGQALVLRTHLWRNFQPAVPPSGPPLLAIFWVYSADSTSLPVGLAADAAWVVNGDEVWDTYFTDEEPPPSQQQPYQLYEIAREGPKWGPGIEVDVVVRLRDAEGSAYLIRAPDEPINRAD